MALVIALAGYRPLATGGRRCRRCGYDLSATPNSHRRCPECGGSLVGGVVEAAASESTIRWRHRLKRAGLAGIVIAIAMASVVGLLDPRRLPHTPVVWLLHVDAPLALRSPDRFATPVMKELLDRTRKTSPVRLPDRNLAAVARSVMARFDEPRHGGPRARELVITAWNSGLITDQEFLDLKWIEPDLELRFPSRATVENIHYQMFGEVRFVAPMVNPSPVGSGQQATFSFEIRPRRYGLGDQPEWVDLGNSRMASTVNHHGGGGGLSIGRHVRPEPGDEFPSGMATFNLDFDVQLVVDSNGRRVKKPSRSMRISTPITIHERTPTKVSMDVSQESCRRLREGLESGSWYELNETASSGGTPGRRLVTVHIGMEDIDRFSLGTPIFRIEAEVDGRQVTRVVDLENSVWPTNPSLRLKVRFPGDRRIVDRYATTSIHDLGAFESLSNLRIRVDTRTFDIALWERMTRAIMPGQDVSRVNPIGCDFTIDIPRLDPEDVELIMLPRGRVEIMDSILESETDTVEAPIDRNEP